MNRPYKPPEDNEDSVYYVCSRYKMMEEVLSKLKLDSQGLIPVVIQDSATLEVLMVAYMNKEALLKTVETGFTHFFSRSRQKLWHKGETSGHVQKVVDIRLDCDTDTLLMRVEQTGVACHEGYPSCFFRRITPQGEIEHV